VSDDEQLDPRIVAALRDLPATSNEIRDAHIAEALTYVSPSVSRRSPRRWLAVAAALAVFAGGVAIGRGTRTSGTEVAASPGSSNPIKNVTPDSKCRGYADSGKVGQYFLGNEQREVWASNGDLFVYVSSTCKKMTTFTIADAPASELVCLPSIANATDSIIGGYTMGNAYRVLVNTPTDILEFSGRSCSQLIKYPQP
jgi:hypothetical protein